MLRAIVIAALAFALFGYKTPGQYKNPYEEAVESFRNGNGLRAIALARQSRSHCLSGSECDWKGRLLEAETLVSDGQLEAAAQTLQSEPPSTPQFRSIQARRFMLQGRVQLGLGKLNEAGRLLEEAERLASGTRPSEVLFDAEFCRGQLLFASRKPDEAESVLRRLLTDAAHENDAYYQALALNGLGFLALKKSRFDEAIPWFERSMKSAGTSGARRIVVAAGNNLGICYSHLGNFNEALRYRKQALDVLGEDGLASYRMNLLGEMGSTYVLGGRSLDGIAYYRRALALARTPADQALWYRNLATAFVQTGELQQAERANQRAIALAADTARALVRQNAAAIAAGRGQEDEAIRLYQEAIEVADNDPFVLWESRAGLADVYARTHSYRLANQEFARTIEVINRNSTRLSKDDYKLTFFTRLIGFYQNYVDALIQQHAFQRALEVADASRARILSQRLALQGKQNDTVCDYPRIARRTRSVLLFYWISPRGSWVWAITPARVYPPFRLPPAEQIQSWVTEYREFIESHLGDPMSTRSEAGDQLYRALIGPVRALVPPGSRVILLADGPLHWLDFDTLPVYDGARPHYWIEDVQSAVAPSLSVLNEHEEPLRSGAPGSLLMIGNPVSPTPEFPSLTYAHEEMEKVERGFPAGEKVIIAGSRAQPEIYRESDPGRFSVVHFSAHAVANQESPLDSAIILSARGDNYKLYARTIATVPLHAELVTISACRSAGARAYSGEGMVGFGWAFLQAGAQNVIAGLWDVTDSSTPEIMDVLYSQINAGKQPAAALRESKLQLIHEAGPFRKPYYWGPFQIYTR